MDGHRHGRPSPMAEIAQLKRKNNSLKKKNKQLQAEVELIRNQRDDGHELLLKTEKLALTLCNACLLIVKDKPTIDLIKRTIKELEKENENEGINREY